MLINRGPFLMISLLDYIFATQKPLCLDVSLSEFNLFWKFLGL